MTVEKGFGRGASQTGNESFCNFGATSLKLNK